MFSESKFRPHPSPIKNSWIRPSVVMNFLGKDHDGECHEPFLFINIKGRFSFHLHRMRMVFLPFTSRPKLNDPDDFLWKRSDSYFGKI